VHVVFSIILEAVVKQGGIRVQTPGEERANAGVHVAALLLIAIATLQVRPFTAVDTRRESLPAVAVYLSTMVALYAASALYHGLPAGRAKQFFMKLDYCAIYLFIAGSYTPFGAGILFGHGGTALLVAIWSLAAAGVVLQVVDKPLHPLLATGAYVAMGWTALAVAPALIRLLPVAGLIWLCAGAVLYTGGVSFFLLDNRVKFAHSIWHLFVLAASACHFVVIMQYA
jgi:hemolysin III